MISAFCHYCRFPLSNPDRLSGFCSPSCRLTSYFNRGNSKRTLFFLLLALCGFLYFGAIGLAVSYWRNSDDTRLFPLFLTTTVLFVCVAPSLLRDLFNFKSNKFWLLVPLATDYAFGIYVLFGHDIPGFNLIPFVTSASMIILYLLLSCLEALCHRKAYEDLSLLHSLRPQRALVLFKNQEIETDVSQLKIGDVVRVKPGEIIPCDGVIVSGTTSVDESMFTAENTVLLKKRGDFVRGASVNRDQTITLEMTTDPQKHAFREVIKLVNASLFQNPKWQAFYEKIPFALSFVFVVSLILFVHPNLLMIPLAMTPKDILSLAVVLGFFAFARPASMIMVLAIGRMACQGIIARSVEVFRRLSKIKTLFFDKTGTLTRGHFFFSQLFLEYGVNQGSFLETVFSLEAGSDHPIARGMETHPWYIEISRHEVKNFESHSGLGVCGTIVERGKKERFAVVGNQRFLKRFQMYISRTLREQIDELEMMGETVILCGWEGQTRGLISFADTLRSDVKPLLTQLKKLHINPVLITGDHDEMMGHLDFARGLEQIYTRCLPTEKANKIKNRQEKGEIVGMVSTSADEEEAFKQADTSIIIGAGTKLIDSPVDVVILGQNLETLADLIRYSRTVHATVKYGTLLSMLYGCGATALAFLGLINPTGALMAMALSGMLLTIFPLRLQKSVFKHSSTTGHIEDFPVSGRKAA